nr:hypothetical protein [uncultured Carboxylicivirga sp.]
MKKLPHSLICVVIMFFQITNINAQFELEIGLNGQVISSLDSTPIPYTHIGVYGRNLMFASDSLGRFKIVFPEGDSLKVLALGYETAIFYVDSLFDQETSVKIIQLKPKLFQVNKIDVSPFKKENDSTEIAND